MNYIDFDGRRFKRVRSTLQDVLEYDKSNETECFELVKDILFLELVKHYKLSDKDLGNKMPIRYRHLPNVYTESLKVDLTLLKDIIMSRFNEIDYTSNKSDYISKYSAELLKTDKNGNFIYLGFFDKKYKNINP